MLLTDIHLPVLFNLMAGYGGGFNERENVEYIEREESDGEYDEVSISLSLKIIMFLFRYDSLIYNELLKSVLIICLQICFIVDSKNYFKFLQFGRKKKKYRGTSNSSSSAKESEKKEVPKEVEEDDHEDEEEEDEEDGDLSKYKLDVRLIHINSDTSLYIAMLA